MKKRCFAVLLMIALMLSSVSVYADAPEGKSGDLQQQSEQEQVTYENQGVHDYVVRMYEVVLERSFEQAGLDDWYNRLVSGAESGALVAYGFFFSKEYSNKQTSDDVFVRHLYKALFDREPDEGGYANWMAQLTAGVPRINVFKGFVDSQEFYNLCERFGVVKGTVYANPDDASVYYVDQFVRRLYTTALGREADASGLADWKENLLNYSKTGSEVAYGFIFSPECINMELDDESYVELLYRALFDRAADEVGKSDWLSLLAEGKTRNYIFAGFVNSTEFAQLCEKYGINKGFWSFREIDPNKPMVALTFDDGPSAHTPRVLDCLEKYNQAATFFVVGTCASVYPEYITRAYEIGCEIGNHSYNHPDLTTLSYAQIQSQMDRTNALIYNATGTYATVTRTPGGSVNSTVKGAINNPIILWSIDTVDWKTRDTQATVNCVLNNVEDGDIVLMHDLHKPTVAAAEIIIPALVARGYQLVTVSELAQYRGNGLEDHKVYYGFTD